MNAGGFSYAVALLAALAAIVGTIAIVVALTILIWRNTGARRGHDAHRAD